MIGGPICRRFTLPNDIEEDPHFTLDVKYTERRRCYRCVRCDKCDRGQRLSFRKRVGRN